MTSRLHFWNIKQLSSAGRTKRYTDAVAAMKTLANEAHSDILALVEVGSNKTLSDLSDELGSEWESLSANMVHANASIGILYRGKRYKATAVRITSQPIYGDGLKLLSLGRDPVALFRMTSAGGGSFLLAVVHFKAEGGAAEWFIRLTIAQWLRPILEAHYGQSGEPIIIGGDFNAEPHEPMFRRDGLTANRRADAATRSKGLQLYNPTWRLLPDPSSLSDLRKSYLAKRTQFTSPNPPGTFLGNEEHSLIDGVIVSSDWLKRDNYEFLEDQMSIVLNPLWHHRGSRGAHHAKAKGAKDADVITDHLPITISVEIP